MTREHGVIVKRCRRCLKVALLYPATYKAAVASLAYQLLYYLSNSLDFVVAERLVLPEMSELREPLRSLETSTPLRSFDVVLIPVSYELDLLWALHALRASGVDPRSNNRPVIVFGGPVAASNPAPFIVNGDVVVVGEVEATLPRLLETLYTGSIEDLECSGGFLTRACIESRERARRVYAARLDDAFHPILEFRVPGSGEPWGEAYLVEVSRGCWRMCRFCLEAHFTMPWRVRSLAKVKRLVEEGVEVNRVRRVAFYSLSFFDYPWADELLEWVVSQGLEASIGSLRVDTLNEKRIELLAAAGQKTVTIAPEVFKPRLGWVLGKVISFETVRAVVEAIVAKGLKPKLYLMTGVPGESLEDVEWEAETAARLAKLAPSMRVTLNPLVPKPWTPLQYAPFVTREWYEKAVEVYRSRLGGRLDALSYRWAWAQAVIARGGFDVGEAVYRASPEPKLGKLLRELRGTDAARRLHTGFEPGESLVWLELVDMGYPVKSLEESYRASIKPPI